ncbi:MAG TPA: acyltransferase [Urbifossiella sp.]|jgi:peptidoglycan/LPS O-acetylase OafA/YrhL|nr:acyltransferase [Urbifossiella sp.]
MSTRPRLDALTGLRFLAAAAVAAVHLHALHHDTALSPTLRRFLDEGFAGVPFFFVLSGFVLAYSYHDRLARPSRGDLVRYALARVARIWPVYLLTLAVVAVWPLVPPPSGGWVVANLLLVHMWPPVLDPHPGLNPAAWSLAEEVFFYTCLPGLLWVAARIPAVGRLGLWAIAGAACLVQSGVMLWHCANLNPWSHYAMFCPPLRLCEFAVGVALGLDYVRAGGGADRPAGGRWFWTGLELAAVAAVVAAVFHSFRVPLLYRLVGYYTPVFALLIAVFARQRGELSRALSGRAAVYLGEVSYSFYLIQLLVFMHLEPWVRAAEVGAVTQAGIFVGTTLLVSAAAHSWVEIPARAWLVGLGRGGPRRQEGKKPDPVARPGRSWPAWLFQPRPGTGTRG